MLTKYANICREMKKKASNMFPGTKRTKLKYPNAQNIWKFGLHGKLGIWSNRT